MAEDVLETLDYAAAAWAPVLAWPFAAAPETLPVAFPAEVRARIAAVVDRESAAVVLKSIRLAKLQSLCVLLGHIQRLEPQLPATEVVLRQSFLAHAVPWAAAGLEAARAGPAAEQSGAFHAGLATAPIWASAPSIGALSAHFVRSLLEELARAIAPQAVPVSISRLLLGHSEMLPGWHDLFAMFLAAELRAEPALQALVPPVATGCAGDNDEDDAGDLDHHLRAVFAAARTVAARLQPAKSARTQAPTVPLEVDLREPVLPLAGVHRQALVRLCSRAKVPLAVLEPRLQGQGALAAEPEAAVLDLLEAIDLHGALLACLGRLARIVGEPQAQALQRTAHAGAYEQAAAMLASTARQGFGHTSAAGEVDHALAMLAVLADKGPPPVDRYMQALGALPVTETGRRLEMLGELTGQLLRYAAVHADPTAMASATAAIDGLLAQAERAGGPGDRAGLTVLKARAELAMGRLQCDGARLLQARAGFTTVIQASTARQVNELRVTALLGLGDATLADPDASAEALGAAQTALEQALPLLRRDAGPFRWICTQRRLGDVLLALARIAGDGAGGAIVKQASDCYLQGVSYCPRDEWPLVWASLQGRLGKSLIIGCDGRTDSARLEAGVEALELALQELSPGRLPVAAANLELWLAAGWELAAEESEVDDMSAALAKTMQLYAGSLPRLSASDLDRHWPAGWLDTLVDKAQAGWARAKPQAHTPTMAASLTLYREAVAAAAREKPDDVPAMQRTLADMLVDFGAKGEDPAPFEEAGRLLRSILADPATMATPSRHIALLLALSDSETALAKRGGGQERAGEARRLIEEAARVAEASDAHATTKRLIERKRDGVASSSPTSARDLGDEFPSRGENPEKLARQARRAKRARRSG